MGKLRTGQSASKCPQAQPRSVQTTRKWAKYTKKHRKEWETLPEFEVWLRADRDDKMLSFCNVCKTTIRPHKSDLAKHAQTTKHRANYNRFNYSGEYIVPDKKERDPLAIEIIKPENPQSVKAEKPRPVKAEKPRPVKADNPRPIKPEESIIIEDIEVEEEYLDENTMAKLDEKIGFIGGGNMAYAIGSGLINRGIVKAGQVTASGPNVENLERWRLIGAGATDDNTETIEKSDIIFICVKPHILEPCSQQIKSLYVPTSKDKDKLFVSVLAGVNLNVLENSFSFIKGLKMIRTMPNTSMQVGEGCTVYTPGSYVTQQDLEKVHLMLNTLGIAQQVPENMIDAITGIAGCGPAYVYTIIEALADGGVKQGIPRQMALQFAAQTLLGAAKTVLLTGKHPAVLRDEVCSPGGSTICGVHELEKGGLRSTLMNAVEKASQRSAELGKK